MTQEDYAVLLELQRVDPRIRREFEAHLRRERDAEREWLNATVRESQLGERVSIEFLHGLQRARWGMGPGGGRRTPIHRPEEHA